MTIVGRISSRTCPKAKARYSHQVGHQSAHEDERFILVNDNNLECSLFNISEDAVEPDNFPTWWIPFESLAKVLVIAQDDGPSRTGYVAIEASSYSSEHHLGMLTVEAPSQMFLESVYQPLSKPSTGVSTRLDLLVPNLVMMINRQQLLLLSLS